MYRIFVPAISTGEREGVLNIFRETNKKWIPDDYFRNDPGLLRHQINIINLYIVLGAQILRRSGSD
jgi:hypothetical protein